MPTLRLVEPHESPAPAETGQPETVPIRLESLPAPLRAVVRDQPDGSLRIEAELPWLAVGTVVHAGPPGGAERSAQVQDFDVEVTDGGSARLVILTATSPAGAAPAAAATSRSPRRRGLAFVGAAIVIAVVAAAGYFLGQLSTTALDLKPARPLHSQARD